ncbi:alpha/beta hydrolase [Testudinibacter sp. TR-2022]|nr:alpha/beta hydrolase [Pasteurellaceae bacterium Phil11]TNH19514.1 alpha/beta hydrolase [Testudinibacter sp. TR-2022]TNH27576.1 alpha/beta hydrolase [Testudinibacter sp. TR-2022]
MRCSHPWLAQCLLKEGLVMKLFHLAAVAVSAVLLSACNGLAMLHDALTAPDLMKVENWQAVGTTHPNFAYGNQPAHKFDLYVPKNKTRAHYGLVVYLHAGGFTTGDKADDAKILQWFASKGYVAAGINYTLKDKANPSASVKSMSDEIKTAIPQVVAKARQLGYPIEKMAIGGGSAGHGLAAIYAYRDGRTAPVPIAFSFGMVGPMSFETDNAKGGADAAKSAEFLSVLSGEKITAEMMTNGTYKEIVKPIEAYRWVNAGSPPALMAFGAKDFIMPFSTKPMTNALQANNVPHDVFIFEKSGHTLLGEPQKRAEYMQKLNEYLATYLPVK